MTLDPSQKKLLLQFQKQEITGSIIYTKLAKHQKDERNKRLLNHIANDERKHYEVYRKLTGKDISPSRWQVFVYSIISYILGPTFTVKLMENNEADDQILYSQMAHLPELPAIIQDEENHEKELIEMISEDR